MQFEKRFVDAAEFFCPEVLVIDCAAALASLGYRKGADGFQEMEIRNVTGVQVRQRSRREQKAAESGESEFRAAIAGKSLHYQFQAAVEVMVSRAGAPGG